MGKSASNGQMVRFLSPAINSFGVALPRMGIGLCGTASRNARGHLNAKLVHFGILRSGKLLGHEAITWKAGS